MGQSLKTKAVKINSKEVKVFNGRKDIKNRIKEGKHNYAGRRRSVTVSQWTKPGREWVFSYTTFDI